MPIKKQIHQNMIQAMKNHDKFAKTMWATLLSSLENEEKGSKNPHEFNDGEASAFLKAQIKQREKSAASYREVGSADRADAETTEAAMISGLLPGIELVRDALKNEAVALRVDTGHDVDMRSFGAVMKDIRSRENLTKDNHVSLEDGRFTII